MINSKNVRRSLFVTLCLSPEFCFNVSSNLSPLRLDLGIRVQLGELVQVGGDQALEGVPDHEEGGARLEEPPSLRPWQGGEFPADSSVTLISLHIIHCEKVDGPCTGGYLQNILTKLSSWHQDNSTLKFSQYIILCFLSYLGGKFKPDTFQRRRVKNNINMNTPESLEKSPVGFAQQSHMREILTNLRIKLISGSHNVLDLPHFWLTEKFFVGVPHAWFDKQWEKNQR